MRAMRRRSRIDANQRALIGDLETFGATVTPLSNVGGGCPDLLVGTPGLTITGNFNQSRLIALIQSECPGARVLQGANLLLEVKNPNDPNGGKLTPDQVKWHSRHKGQKAIVRSRAEILDAIGRTAK